MVQQYLPDFGFNPIEIKSINGMIMATKISQAPKSQLEGIIADAGLDYLGKEGFYLISLSFKRVSCILVLKIKMNGIYPAEFSSQSQLSYGLHKEFQGWGEDEKIREIELLVHSTDN